MAGRRLGFRSPWSRALWCLAGLVLAACGTTSTPSQADGNAAATPASVVVTTARSAGLTSSTTAEMPDTFSFEVSPITMELADRMTPSSWRDGCPVPLADLRYLRIAYLAFDDTRQIGEMVVHHDVVDDMRTVFGQLFAARVPIRRMNLIDDYDGDDFVSIEANNTSAFNCRVVTGGNRWSEHAFGRAIDINPIENPYVSHGRTSHPASSSFLDRTDVRPGMATEGGPLVAAFDRVGWSWGGRWNEPVDYQHFSLSGR